MSKKSKSVIIYLFILIIFSVSITLLISEYIKNSNNYLKVFSMPITEATQDIKIGDKNIYKENINLEDQQSTIVEQPTIDIKDNMVNILFLGIDRTDYRDEILGVYRTDSILLASINLITKEIDVLCIPRDTYVYIPCIENMDKINHAYVWGGMNKEGIKSTIATVNNFVKYAKADYYFALDMEPIISIVDSLGGVEIDVELDMKTEGAELNKGFQLLDGKKAFDYIHWRFSGNGDIDRVKRQQKFLKAMLDKFKKDGNILQALKIVVGYNKYIQSDLNTTQLIALANLYKNISADNINFHNISGYDGYIDGVSYWITDEEKLEEELVEMFKK